MRLVLGALLAAGETLLFLPPPAAPRAQAPPARFGGAAVGPARAAPGPRRLAPGGLAGNAGRCVAGVGLLVAAVPLSMA